MIDNFIFPIDHIILAIACIILIFSFWKGIIGSILGLLTWIGSIIITIYFYKDLSNFINSQLLKINILENYEQITKLLSTIISVPLIFFIAIFILKKTRNIITSDLDKQILGVMIDKIFGFLFGFIFNYIIFSTLLYFTDNIEFLIFLNDWIIDNSFLLLTLDNFNNNLLSSIIGIEREVIN